MRFASRALVIVGAVAALAMAPAALAGKPGGGGGGGGSTYPSSMDALGDSITRAFNTCSFPFTDCVQNSWSTGTNSTVNSHYSRLLKLNSAINGNDYNDAVSGAKAADVVNQANNAVSHKAQYITIAIGANDACTSSESTMTSVSSYESSIATILTNLGTNLPNSKFLLASVPDVYHLWDIFHTNTSAVNTWNAYGICQSLLANATSTAQTDVDRRAAVRQRTIDFNTALATECAKWVNCKFDNNAAFNYQFSTSQVSTRDYFHPTISGQAAVSSVEWSAGWF